MALAANANNANTGMDDSQSETGADMAPLFDIHASVQDYGITGEVKVIPYTKIISSRPAGADTNFQNSQFDVSNNRFKRHSLLFMNISVTW